jgi:hypothetical protein
MRSSTSRADLSSPVRRQERNRFSWIVHVSGVSDDVRSDMGQGSELAGEDARTRGACCERWSAVAGEICGGGSSRVADMAAVDEWLGMECRMAVNGGL